jgi:hypothetical protein
LSTALRKLHGAERVDPVEWAGIQPWFRRQGLKTVEDVVTGRRTVIYNEHAGWDAVEEFFDLTPVLAEMLFSRKMVKGRSSKEVAERIDNLIRKTASLGPIRDLRPSLANWRVRDRSHAAALGHRGDLPLLRS